jgi:HEAT repeat protein
LGSNVAAWQLVAALDDNRPEVRSVILASLAKLGDKQTTLGIVPRLRDAEINVRCAAAMTLGELHDLRATPALTAALADSAASVRREAAAALGKTGDWRAGERLWRLLDDADDGVARNAAWALAEIGDRQYLCSSGSVAARNSCRTAAEALGRLAIRAIAALGNISKHPDSEIAGSAAKIRPEAVAELARRIHDQVLGSPPRPAHPMSASISPPRRSPMVEEQGPLLAPACSTGTAI